jgi:diguanylate cyclase (GGDEF)-like protein
MKKPTTLDVMQAVHASRNLNQLRLALEGLSSLFPTAFLTCAIRDGEGDWRSLMDEDRVAAKMDCWGAVYNQLHVFNPSQPEFMLRCEHLHQDFKGLAICVPISAEAEFFGILRGEWCSVPVPKVVSTWIQDFRILALTLGFTLRDIKHRDRSSEDILSGLKDRRSLNESLPQQCAVAQRTKSCLSLLMIDLDGFKAVNDEVSHAAGDQWIASMGKLLRENIRISDMGFRYGGDEFVVSLPSTDLSAATAFAEQIRAKIQQSPQIPSMPVTASIGVAELRTHVGANCRAQDAAQKLLLNADRAIKVAKTNGKNQVVVAEHQ